MIRRKTLFARLAILAVVLSCLGFAALTPNTQTALSRPCCEECNVPIPPEEGSPSACDYCIDQCGGATYGTCYDTCLSDIYTCWRSCESCSGGGDGGGSCAGGCPIGTFCAADNTCTP